MVKATQTHTHLKVQTSNTIVRLIPTIKNHLFKESQTPLKLDLTMRPFWFNMCAAGRHPHSCVRTWLGPDTPLKRERKRSHSLRWSDLFGNIFLCSRFDKYLFVLCQVAPGQPHCSLPAGREEALHWRQRGEVRLLAPQPGETRWPPLKLTVLCLLSV